MRDRFEEPSTTIDLVRAGIDQRGLLPREMVGEIGKERLVEFLGETKRVRLDLGAIEGDSSDGLEGERGRRKGVEKVLEGGVEVNRAARGGHSEGDREEGGFERGEKRLEVETGEEGLGEVATGGRGEVLTGFEFFGGVLLAVVCLCFMKRWVSVAPSMSRPSPKRPTPQYMSGTGWVKRDPSGKAIRVSRKILQPLNLWSMRLNINLN